MSAAVIDELEIEQGTYWRQEFIYQDSDGDAIDVSGFEGQMQLRRTREASDPPVATFASAGAPIQPGDEPNGTITLGDDGSIVLEMEADQTGLIQARSYVYDFELVPPDGKIVKLFMGSIAIEAAVTRD